MNARQMKKRLKRQIDTLQSDNILMHEIIADSPKMQELYDLYTKPSKITTMPFQELRVKRMIPIYMVMSMSNEETIEHTKQLAAMDLFEEIKKNITYEIYTELESTSIMASIFIGRKE